MITPETASIIEAAIEDDRIDLHTGLPGVVTRVVGKKVDVEVGVQRLLDNGYGILVPEKIGTLLSVKVYQPKTKKFFMHFPIEVSDEGLIFFTEAPIGQWLAGGTDIPEDAGRHTLAGAVFFPGLVRDEEEESITPQTSGMVIGVVNGAYVSVEENGTITMENSAGSAVLAASGTCSINGSNFTVDP